MAATTEASATRGGIIVNKLKYRKAWRFPEAVEDFIAAQCEGFTINVMNGDSQLGDLRIDNYTENTDIKADALQLPLKSEIADTVVCDPPWEMDNRVKPKLMLELKRILKFGGKLLFNSTWSPKSPGLSIETIYVPQRQLMTYQHISLIFIARKVKSQFPAST